MSEDLKDASTQDDSGSGAPPMPDPEGSGQGSATEGQALADALARIEDLSNQVSDIPELIDRRFKSGQDRNVSRIEKDVDELRELIEKSGGDYDVVATDITIRDLQ